MKRRKFMLSAGWVGISTVLLGNNLFMPGDDYRYWNYPASLSPEEINHIHEIAGTMLEYMPARHPNNKKWVRSCLEPVSLVKKEENAEGYRITYKNKVGNVVIIYKKGGRQFTQIA